MLLDRVEIEVLVAVAKNYAGHFAFRSRTTQDADDISFHHLAAERDGERREIFVTLASPHGSAYGIEVGAELLRLRERNQVGGWCRREEEARKGCTTGGACSGSSDRNETEKRCFNFHVGRNVKKQPAVEKRLGHQSELTVLICNRRNGKILTYLFF